MIKDNQSGLNRLHVVLDALVTVVSYLLAWYIVIGSGWARQLGKKTLEMEFYLGALIVIVPGYLLLYSFFNLYTPKRVLGRRNEFGKILRANTIGLLIFGLVLYYLGEMSAVSSKKERFQNYKRYVWRDFPVFVFDLYSAVCYESGNFDGAGAGKQLRTDCNGGICRSCED